MTRMDEPLLAGGEGTLDAADVNPVARERIQRLLDDQAYAVLCVQGGGQPYGALVAYAFSADMKHAVFATPVTTRKYRLLSENDRVALVIDTRPSTTEEVMDAAAVTATGRSHLIERGAEFDRWSRLLISRHPYLKPFIKAATCALFRVDVYRFFHVERFQEVRQWVPTDSSS